MKHFLKETTDLLLIVAWITASLALIKVQAYGSFLFEAIQFICNILGVWGLIYLGKTWK